MAENREQAEDCNFHNYTRSPSAPTIQAYQINEPRRQSLNSTLEKRDSQTYGNFTSVGLLEIPSRKERSQSRSSGYSTWSKPSEKQIAEESDGNSMEACNLSDEEHETSLKLARDEVETGIVIECNAERTELSGLDQSDSSIRNAASTQIQDSNIADILIRLDTGLDLSVKKQSGSSVKNAVHTQPQDNNVSDIIRPLSTGKESNCFLQNSLEAHDGSASNQHHSWPHTLKEDPDLRAGEHKLIPVFVQEHRVSSSDNSNSRSSSIELPAEFTECETIINKAVLSNGHTLDLISVELLSTTCIERDFNISSVLETWHHDQYALSTLQSLQPSLAAMRCYYGSDICRGEGVTTDAELNSLLEREIRRSEYSILLENLKILNSSDEDEDVILDLLCPPARAPAAQDGGDIQEDCACATPEAELIARSPLIPQPRRQEEDQDISVASLEKAVQCTSAACTDSGCQYGRTLLRQLNTMVDELRMSGGVYEFCCHMLRQISAHSTHCPNRNYCVVPWCKFFSGEEEECFADRLLAFKREYMPSTLGYANLIDEEQANFVPLVDEGYNSLPIEHEDILVRVVNYKDVFLALDFRKCAQVILKRRQFRHESLEVIKKLGGLQTEDSHLVVHNWAATVEHYSPSRLLTCLAYSGTTVREALCMNPEGFDSPQCEDFLQQLHGVSTFLHRNRVLYLNWSSDHVLLKRLGDNGRHHVVLFNFDLCVTQDMQKEDVIEHLTLYLPPQLLPPEIHEHERCPRQSDLLFPQSDYWGLGCLMYELCTGKSPFLRWQHSPQAEQLWQVRNSHPTALDVLGKGLRLSACVSRLLRVHPRERVFTISEQISSGT